MADNYGRSNGSKSNRPSSPFLNPYNFVSTSGTGSTSAAQSAPAGAHTGYYDCVLVTRTPLAIPDHEDHDPDSKDYPFMRVGDERIIPGSSIRGAIRSIYETATNSCMTVEAVDAEIRKKVAKKQKTYNARNERKPCSNRQSLCAACALFGMVGQDNAGGVGSRVRFTDAGEERDGQESAQGQSANEEHVYVQLKELSSPKPPYLPFYMTDGENGEVYIRGRKFYWHNPQAAKDPGQYTAAPDANTSRSSRMELVPPETVFRFRVYYDRVTEEQRDMLAWALTLGENNRNGNHCIKLGHGKPIGLGSAKVIIEGMTERSIGSASYHVKSPGQEEIRGYIADGERLLTSLDELRIITEFDANYDQNKERNKVEIRYPELRWFSQYNKAEEHLPRIQNAVNKPLQPWYSTSGGNGNKRSAQTLRGNGGNQGSTNVERPRRGDEFVLTVKRINKKGDYILNGKGSVNHFLYASQVQGTTLHEGDRVRVAFYKDTTYDNGSVTFSYSYVRKES